MEKQILSTVLKSRADYQIINQYIDPKKWSREFQIMFGFAHDYYERDATIQFVDREVFAALLAASIQNPKHVEKFVAYADEAFGMQPSGANIRQVVLSAKREELAQSLALAIANGKDHGDLLTDYAQLLKVDVLEDAESNIEEFDSSHLMSLLEEDADGTNRIPIYPRSLNERLGGGASGSDAFVLMGRPNISKTGLVLTITGKLAKDGHEGVLFNNEERIQRLMTRQVSNLINKPSDVVRQNVRAAYDEAMGQGFGNVKFAAMSPGSLSDIERKLDKHPDAKYFIVDQMRNILVRSENKTTQLELVAQGIRNIAKERNLVAISITQAGDSAENKSILDMGDADGSNTGIPGACDVFIGIGANAQQKAEGIRVLSLIKNKLTGDEESFPTRFNPQISKYVSI